MSSQSTETNEIIVCFYFRGIFMFEQRVLTPTKIRKEQLKDEQLADYLRMRFEITPSWQFIIKFVE